jgi:hypothetical protein
MIYRIIKCMLSLLIYIKMLFYMRIHDKFGNMIALFMQCIFDLTSFAIFFVSLILLFSLMFSLLQNEVYDKYYPDMNYF